MRDIEDIRIRDSHTSPPSRTRYNCIFEIDLNIDVSSVSFYKFRNPVVAQYDWFSFLYCQICSFFSFKKLYIHECICIRMQCMHILYCNICCHVYSELSYIWDVGSVLLCEEIVSTINLFQNFGWVHHFTSPFFIYLEK